MAIVSRNGRTMRFSLIAVGIAALVLGSSPAEAAKRLALVIAVYRHYRTTNVRRLNQLKG